MKLKTLIALIAGAVYGLAQTPPQIPSTVELMQTRGAINTALAQVATIACAGTPGNTTGAYGQQCQTTLGARYSCNNAAGCTVAADWVFSGSMSWPSGAGIAVYNGSGGWGTSLSPSAFEPALGNPSVSGYVLSSTTGGVRSWVAQSGGGGSMVYPAAGVPNSTGSAWGSSYTVGTAANNLVQLNGSAQLPAVSAALLTNWPTFNQNTSGTAGGLTSQYVDWSAASGGASIANKPALGTASSHAATDFQTALANYSTISGLTGYPSTFPPTTSGDWTGTWGTHAASYFQTAISGAPGTWPSFGGAALLNVGTGAGDVAAGNAKPATAGAADTAAALAANQGTTTTVLHGAASGTPGFAAVTPSDFGVQNANKVLAGPVTGADATPTYRALVSADIPANAANTSGKAATAGNADTVTNGVTASANITDLYSVIGDGGTKGVKVGPAIATAATASTIAQRDSSGVLTAVGFSTGASDALLLQGLEEAAPTVTTPTVYLDSTAHLPQYLNASSVTVGTMVAPLADPGTDHSWVKYIPATGVPSRTRPACADLSDSGAGCSGVGGLGVADTPVTQSGATVTYAATANKSSETFVVTLTASITSASFTGTNATTGELFTFKLCENGTGGWTHSTPSNVTNWQTIPTAASSCSYQSGYWTGTGLEITTGGITTATGDALYFSDGKIALPSAPATLVAASALGTASAANTASACTGNNWSQGWTTGSNNCTQPAFSNLSGAATVTQVPGVQYIVSSGSIGAAITAAQAYITCTTTCSVTLPAPTVNPSNQFCIDNAPGSATVITLAGITNIYWSLTTNAGWGTASHSLVSGGAVTDQICVAGYDTTHYKIKNFTGTWTD